MARKTSQRCENTYVNNYSLFFYFQHRKRSNQGYGRHCHFILSNITQHNLHPPYLAMAFPFPCFIKEELAGVWTRDPESLSQRHFTHGAACRLTHHSLVCTGWDMTKLEKQENSGDFFPSFFGKRHKKGNRKEFWWF